MHEPFAEFALLLLFFIDMGYCKRTGFMADHAAGQLGREIHSKETTP